MDGPDLLTTPAVLDRVAGALPDHPALIAQDRTLTFAQLRAEVRAAAAVMIAAGVGAGDRVAVQLPNCWQWVVAALGTHYAGGVLVPLNPAFTTAETTDILARSRARLLICSDESAEVDPASLPDLLQVVPAEFLTGSGASLASPADVDARAGAVHPDDVADILFTSGTTGRSKGVLCLHRQALSTSAAAAEARQMTPADRYLGVVPFFHNYGYKDGILGCMQAGAAVVPQRSFDPEQAMRAIAEHRITVLTGPPVMFQAILDHPRRGEHDLNSLRVGGTGGTTLPAPLVRRIVSDLGFDHVRTGYGLTEASGFGTVSRPGDDVDIVAATCGRPIAGFELRIDALDESGIGEVLLRGPNVMLGYLDDPDATAAAIDPDGWLHTGDLGTLDDAGNLTIVDRRTDMYISAGTNVYPAEIEKVLTRLPGVVAAAVIGVPDPRRGETGHAFIVLKPGADLDPHAVIAHARRHLAGYKIPRSITFCEELPRTSTGKIRKTELRRRGSDTPPLGITPRGLGGPPVGPIENWVADTWQVLLNIPRPGRRDPFVDLGGDSLAAAEFAAMLHTQLDITMSLDALAQRPTIAAIVAGLDNAGTEHRQPVVQLRTAPAGPVCLMIPGIGGHAWKFLALANALRVPCDLHGLSLTDLRHDLGRSSTDRIRDRIHHTALNTLTSPAAQGRPIMIAGYSFGAMIAAELTSWLTDRGIPVTKLLLIDPDPLDSDVPAWNPRTSHMSAPQAVVFSPGSAAARQLDNEMSEVAVLLQAAYLNSTIRLPSTPVAWVQSRGIAEKYPRARTLFGTPIAQIDRTRLDLGHFDIVEIPGVHQLATWLDQELSAPKST